MTAVSSWSLVVDLQLSPVKIGHIHNRVRAMTTVLTKNEVMILICCVLFVQCSLLFAKIKIELICAVIAVVMVTTLAPTPAQGERINTGIVKFTDRFLVSLFQ